MKANTSVFFMLAFAIALGMILNTMATPYAEHYAPKPTK